MREAMMPVRSWWKMIENLDQYDAVFLGYPIGGTGVPMALLTFWSRMIFLANKCISFVLHGTGGLSNSVNIITEAAPDASISDNIFDCYEEDASSSQNDIQSWVTGLGY